MIRAALAASSAARCPAESAPTGSTELEGYGVARGLGVVRGVTVSSRSIFGTIGGALQTLAGGSITLFTELCDKTRGEAFAMMPTPSSSAPTPSSACGTTRPK